MMSESVIDVLNGENFSVPSPPFAVLRAVSQIDCGTAFTSFFASCSSF
ncbi:hypothetical protein Ctob_015273, partial [Chrysochromulina tobinii]